LDVNQSRQIVDHARADQFFWLDCGH
jgi:hypothetical protein